MVEKYSHYSRQSKGRDAYSRCLTPSVCSWGSLSNLVCLYRVSLRSVPSVNTVGTFTMNQPVTTCGHILAIQVNHVVNLVAKYKSITRFAVSHLHSVPYPVPAQPCSRVRVLHDSAEYLRREKSDDRPLNGTNVVITSCTHGTLG